MTLPLPASTVAIINDGDNGIEVLMVRRNENLANAAGAWAFPGGRVEDEDYLETDDHKLAAQCAAVRETIEETGLCLTKENLIPFAHWTTPEGPRRRYATWFFITELASPPAVRVDGNEIVDHCWLTPHQVLQRHREGMMEITAPGFITLTRLIKFSNSNEAIATFAAQDLLHYNPKLLKTNSGRIIFYEGDAGYDTCNIDIKGERNRIVMTDTEWHYQTTLHDNN